MKVILHSTAVATVGIFNSVLQQHTRKWKSVHINLPYKQALRKERTGNYNSAMGNLFFKASMINTKKTRCVNSILPFNN